MAEHSFYPGYVKLNYHSAWGTHTQLICTSEWNNVPLVPGNALGSFTNWSALPCDGEEMVIDMVDALKAWYTSTTVFDTATVYTLAAVGAPAIPRATLALGAAGTLVSALWAKAVQHTYVIRDTAYNMCKLILLDAPIGTSWDATSNISGSPQALALVGAFTSSSWAWSSKATLQPQTFQKITYKLNDKLREEYGMG